MAPKPGQAVGDPCFQTGMPILERGEAAGQVLGYRIAGTDEKRQQCKPRFSLFQATNDFRFEHSGGGTSQIGRVDLVGV